MAHFPPPQLRVMIRPADLSHKIQLNPAPYMVAAQRMGCTFINTNPIMVLRSKFLASKEQHARADSTETFAETGTSLYLPGKQYI